MKLFVVSVILVAGTAAFDAVHCDSLLQDYRTYPEVIKQLLAKYCTIEGCDILGRVAVEVVRTEVSNTRGAGGCHRRNPVALPVAEQCETLETAPDRATKTLYNFAGTYLGTAATTMAQWLTDDFAKKVAPAYASLNCGKQ